MLACQASLRNLENTLQFEGQKLPNETHPDVPDGGEENATLMAEVLACRMVVYVG